ncbi:MAG: ATP-binding protein [Coriobacteriales bacterium]|jgi:predicted AAA+ superfamily ATPase|nr:ATP-binding protein [Coriobacteriales bacterium]
MALYERQLTGQIVKRMAEPRRFLQIITGPRQTGKTVAVEQALEKTNTPQHFVSADTATVASRQWLENEWRQARALTAKASGEALLVVDEIQRVQDWSLATKALWDEDSHRKTPLKVLLTGSSSMLLQKGMAESLMGRFELLYSTHWSYRECQEAFGYSLEDYLFFGGYPGAAALKDDVARWARYIGTTIVEPTISQDVLMMEEVRKPALLRALFMLGASYSAQELSYTKMIGQLQDAGNTVTVAHYLDLLQKAGMLCGLQKFSLEKTRTQRSAPRLMVFDPSLMTYAEGARRKRLLEDPEAYGHLVESAVGAYLLARGREEGFDVFYWRERDQEVDFIIQQGSAITAIEVKSGRLRRPGGSLAFLKKYPQALALIVGSPSVPLEDFLLGRVALFESAV